MPVVPRFPLSSGSVVGRLTAVTLAVMMLAAPLPAMAAKRRKPEPTPRPLTQQQPDRLAALMNGQQLAPLPQVVSRRVLGNPAVTEMTLNNGHKVYVQERHNQPVVTLDTWVATGSVNEDASNNGVSHFLEHLLFKGTRSYGPRVIDHMLASRGIEFNAATSKDFTHYYMVMQTRDFPLVAKLHAEMLTQATIPAEELDAERKVVQEEINRANDNPNAILFDKLHEQQFPHHGYALDTLGPKSLIGSISRDAILTYYHRWYRPQHFHTVVVGDVTPDEALKTVVEAFYGQGMATRYAPAAPSVVQPISGQAAAGTVQLVSFPTVSQSTVIVSFPGPPVSSDPVQMLALDVAFKILSERKTGVLETVLKDQKRLVTDIGGGTSPMRYGGSLYVLYKTDPEKITPAFNALTEVLGTVLKTGLTAEEVERAKRNLIKTYAFQHESTQSVAEAIGYNVSTGAPLEYHTGYLERVKALKPSDVNTALSRWLQPRQAGVTALVPCSVAGANASALQSTLSASLRQWAPTTTPAVATTSPTTSTATASRADTTPTRLTTRHGARVIVNPTPGSETVHLRLFIPKATPETTAALGELATRTLLDGTQQRDGAALQAFMEANGLNVDIDSEADYTLVSASSLREDYPLLLTLLAEVLFQPRFAHDDVEREATVLAKQLQSALEQPSTAVFDAYACGFYGPTSRYGQCMTRLLKQDPRSVDAKKVRTYWQQTTANPQGWVVALSGDDQASPLGTLTHRTLESWFPTLPQVAPTASLARTPLEAVAFADSKKSRQQTVRLPIQHAVWMVQGWPVPGIVQQGRPDSERRTLALKVLNSLLGTGMNSRLFVGLREKQGLAYVVGSTYSPQAGASSLALHIGTDPANQDAALKGFRTELEKIAQGDVSEQEHQEAISKLTGMFALNHESPAQQAHYLGFYELMGLTYGYDRQYPEKLRTVTRDEVRQAAQWLLSQPSYTVIVAPQTKKKG